jgi:hypothetical protein
MRQLSTQAKQMFLIAALIAFGILTRFMPHPANFTAIGAVALFAGAAFPKRWGVFIPLASMIVSDLFIGFHQLVLFTWGSMAISGFIGVVLRNRIRTLPVVIGTLISSLQFFLITNWAVWQFSPLYEKTSAGLLQSYIAGIPFYRNMLAGDFFYVALLFGVLALARKYVASPVSQSAK